MCTKLPQQMKQNTLAETRHMLTFKKAALLAGSAVSRTVPSTKTILMSCRVWYVCTKQHHL